MRAAFSTVAVVAMLVALASAQYYPKAWVDLFQPPYQNSPQIMMSIGCVSNDSCIVPGGSNGVGFGVYAFDGTYNGNFNALEDIDNSPIDFLLQVGVGGTKSNPKGAVGGMGLLFGLKYFVNSSTLAPAITTPFTETMDIRTDKTGNKVLLVDGLSAPNWAALYSTDAGHTYTSITIPNTSIAMPNCTIPSYQAIAADGVWYFAAGSFPPSKNSGSSSGGTSASSSSAGAQTERNIHPRHSSSIRHVKEHIGILRPGADIGEVIASGFKPGKKHPLRLRKSALQAHKNWIAAGRPVTANDGPVCGYSAAIISTTDAGKTWNVFNFAESTWSISDIDCINATTCVAVASGLELDAGSRVLATTDGKTWSTIYKLQSTSDVAFLLNSIRFNPANPQEIWVAGGIETANGNQAVFYYSRDSGKTWVQHDRLNFVDEVLQMSFAPDGTGFAVGITQFDDSTIMRYTFNGPNPTPAPAWNGNFSQIQCADNACSVNCTVFSFPQGMCLNLTGGGSAIGQCDMTDQVLIQNVYPLDTTCWGPAEAQPMPLNQCYQNNGGGSFMSVCGPVTMPHGVQEGSSVGVAPMRPKHLKRKL